MAKREAQIVDLLARGGEQEIGLVARRVGGAVQLGPGRTFAALDVVAGGKAVGFQFAGRGHEIAEFHPLVAADAGNRGGAGEILVGELLDYRFTETVFISNIMIKIDRINQLEAASTDTYFK